MDKIIDFRKTVYELATEYPEFKEIMASVGFKEITEPEILASAGKIMTVPKGSRMKGIPMEQILKAFREKGFQVIGVDEAPVPPTPPTPPSAPAKPPVPPAAQYNFPTAKPERASQQGRVAGDGARRFPQGVPLGRGGGDYAGRAAAHEGRHAA